MAVLVGKSAPDFNVKAVIDGETIVDSYKLSDLKGKNVILFFYPLDFTYVCPTELHAFQERLSDFESRNVQVVACSVDSWFSHAAWLKTPKSQGGIQGVTYPILSDFNKTIATDYDVLVDGMGASYRGLFLIDSKGIVRHQVVNDLPLGRNVDEVIRMVDALLFTEKYGEVCPANWQEGEKSMVPNAEGLKAYFSK